MVRRRHIHGRNVECQCDDPPNPKRCGAHLQTGVRCVYTDGHEGPHETTIGTEALRWAEPHPYPIDGSRCPAETRYGAPCSLPVGHRNGWHRKVGGGWWREADDEGLTRPDVAEPDPRCTWYMLGQGRCIRSVDHGFAHIGERSPAVTGTTTERCNSESRRGKRCERELGHTAPLQHRADDSTWYEGRNGPPLQEAFPGVVAESLSSAGAGAVPVEAVAALAEPTTWVAALDVVMAEQRALMITRHEKYGPGNITAHGELGCEVRCSDKLARIRNARESGREDFDDDSLDDAWRDLSNYPLAALMLRRGWWELPYEPTERLGEVVPDGSGRCVVATQRGQCDLRNGHDGPHNFDGICPAVRGGKHTWVGPTPQRVPHCASCGVKRDEGASRGKR